MDVNTLARFAAYLGAGLGAGLTIIGGAAGIGRLAEAAMEGIARQPNSAGDIRLSMIVAAGFIEGIAFFALVVAILLALVKV
jgi:F-type H+-transporting ATPase subunit c